MRRTRPLRAAIVATTLAALTACSSVVPPPRVPSGEGGTYKVGQPYKVKGVWYRPAADMTYNKVGIASWYGPKFHGMRTANGERFDMNALTAAHKTLPMPSAVRVTNLRNGRSIVVRVNDRGPFVGGRIIDLSRRAAQLLGFDRQGTTRVRVEILPDESRRLAYIARYGEEPPAPKPVEVASRDDGIALPEATRAKAPADAIYVQIGAFGVFDSAARLAHQANAYGRARISELKSDAGMLYRVRLGPVSSEGAALDLAEHLLANGFNDARIVFE